MHRYRLGVDKLESSFAEQALQVWWTPNCLEPAIHPCSKEAQWHPELHQEEPHQHLVNVYKCLVGGNKDDEPRLFVVVSIERTRGNGHKLKQEILFKHMKKLLQYKGDRTQELAAQRHFAVFMSRYTQNLTRCCSS